MSTDEARRTAVVTGVSRRQGIAFAVAQRLLWSGIDMFVTHHQGHDAEQPWGADDLEAVLADLGAIGPGRLVGHCAADLADEAAPGEVIAQAREAAGHVDVLVCVHARSGGDGRLADQSAEMIDTHFAVNTRSTLLLTKAFAEQHDGRPGGRVIWFTSGQGHGPMRDEIAYITSKAALAGAAPSVADDLIDDGITLNVVNPGPVDTGYLGEVPPRPMPRGRWGVPQDPAKLVGFLVSEDADWITGQVISSEGGFRRHAPVR